jgi:hypothetical protein
MIVGSYIPNTGHKYPRSWVCAVRRVASSRYRWHATETPAAVSSGRAADTYVLASSEKLGTVAAFSVVGLRKRRVPVLHAG